MPLAPSLHHPGAAEFVFNHSADSLTGLTPIQSHVNGRWNPLCLGVGINPMAAERMRA